MMMRPKISGPSAVKYRPEEIAPSKAAELLPATSWWSRVAFGVLTSAWLVNAMLLIGMVAWMYFDGRSSNAIDVLQENVGRRTEALDSMTRSAQSTSNAVVVLVAASAVAGCTLLTMLVGLFVGPRRFRSIRAWLLFTMLVGGWLGTVIAGPEIYWLGQQRRMARVLAPVESVAQQLDANWPVEDGDMPGIGPYLAYPKGAPTLVLPLKWISFPNTDLRFAAVERSNNGVVRFELTGSESGAWLEWRADDRPPQPFKSGLEMRYNVSRQQRLAPHWYLVHYRLASIRPS
jgi:hypothetical protein